jgi:Domain of unknown function (DUF932)
MTAMTSFRQNRPLTADEMFKYAPSIFATEAHESRSERFAPIATYDVVQAMQAQGFQPFAVQQARTRVAGKAAYTKHLLRFRAEGFVKPKVVGETSVELVLQNANDGTSAYKLSLGVFRLVCLNGMVTGQSYENISVRHTGKAIDDVIDGTFTVLGQADRVVSQVEGWQALPVTRPEAMLLANAAHSLRYPEAHLAEDDEAYKAAPVSPERLLTARRWDDQDRTNLWTAFNVLQENTIRGGLRGVGQRAGRDIRAVTRPVRGIDQNTALNRALWTMAEEFAKLKQAA